MIHKIYSSTQNPRSNNSARLHLTELRGTAEDAHRLMDDLQEQGHSLNGWIYETEEERAQREQPWPGGQRHAERWGRA